MNKYRYNLTFANGATETIDARTASEAASLRVYTKHKVVSVKRGKQLTDCGHMELFN